MFHLSVSVARDERNGSELDRELREVGARLLDERQAVDLSSPMPVVQSPCELRLFADSGSLTLDDFPFQTLPLKRGTLVLVLGLPQSLDVFGFLEVIQGIGDFVVLGRRNFRPELFLSENELNRSLLIRFIEQKDADNFHRGFHLQYFDQLQPAPAPVCYVLFIDRLILRAEMFPEPPALSDEIPACPLCAERLDSDVSGLILSRKGWLSRDHVGCSSCSACSKLVGDTELHCDSCNTPTTPSLWLCLLCGHVGCGRYSKGCAQRHSKSMSHRFCLEISSGRVWDYKREKWVHRKVFTKSEAVELPEIFERATMLGISPEEDLAGLEEEMQICLETERRKLENACVELEVRGFSEISRHEQFLEADKAEVNAVKAEIKRLTAQLGADEAARHNYVIHIDRLSREIAFLKNTTKAQLETLKSNQCNPLLQNKLYNSRSEKTRLEEEVASLSAQISSL